jgi:hypothetical protein
MAKFILGKLCCTSDVSALINENPGFKAHVWGALGRYVKGDWGDMDAGDKACNDAAISLPDGGRIFAAYKEKDHPEWRIWIITEADRSYTTVLFPDEY